MGEHTAEIEKTLRSIFEYTGTDPNYAKAAQLHTYVERLVEKCSHPAERDSFKEKLETERPKCLDGGDCIPSERKAGECAGCGG